MTDGDGRHAFPALPSGSYVVTFTLPGFERAERNVELAAGLTATVDVDLRVGDLFEDVTVSVTGTAIDAPTIDMPHAVTAVSRDTLIGSGAVPDGRGPCGGRRSAAQRRHGAPARGRGATRPD